MSNDINNLTSVRTLAIKSNGLVARSQVPSLAETMQEEIQAEKAIVMNAMASLEKQIGADIEIVYGQLGGYLVGISSNGTDDMDEIIDAALDLQQALGTATTDIRLVDSYGEVILGEDYVAD